MHKCQTYKRENLITSFHCLLLIIDPCMYVHCYIFLFRERGLYLYCVCVCVCVLCVCVCVCVCVCEGDIIMYYVWTFSTMGTE